MSLLDPAPVQRFYQAFLSGNEAGMRAELHSDCTWSVEGEGPLSGMHRGPEGVLKLFRRKRELTTGTFRAWRKDSHDLCVSPDHVVLLDRYIAERGSQELDSHQAHVIELLEGKLFQVFTYYADQAATEAFFRAGVK